MTNSKTIFTNSDLRGSLNYLMEANDVEFKKIDLEATLNDVVDDDLGRMSYIRQLTAEFLEYLMTINDELKDQVEIPKSEEIMNKMLGRAERKRYYMSKFRL